MRKGLTGDTSLSETGTVYGSISTSLAAYSTKLVPTALEWPYEAKAPNVRAETLEKAAELLVLRRDTLWIIDGAGPSLDAPLFEFTAAREQANRTEGEGVSTKGNSPENTVQAHTSQTDKGGQASSARSEHATEYRAVVDQKHIAISTKCTFSGMVPIDLTRYLSSGVTLVEYPDCAATRTLEPHAGVLRFKSHDKRKTTTPHTGQRWAREETDWDVVGGESRQGA